jgi:hypothetical protein
VSAPSIGGGGVRLRFRVAAALCLVAAVAVGHRLLRRGGGGSDATDRSAPVTATAPPPLAGAAPPPTRTASASSWRWRQPPRLSPHATPATRAAPSDIPTRPPEVIQRERELATVLKTLAAGHPGVQVAFADCSSGACVGRVQATEGPPLDAFVADARHARRPAPFTIQVRERLTAFNGRLFEADLTEEGAPTQ